VSQRDQFRSRLGRPCDHCGRVPGRLNPESPGLKRLVEIAQDCKPMDLIALRGFGLEDAWLEPGERFQCEQRMAADLTKAGVTEQIVNPS
jgi:hypothetical protein